ncbi:hypothetical protein COB55_03620 [Candidatus Wolfebacteria bacterium]|nr:MAG: hypothetical protein COB55_03620 [Candidatus Wolfebacteria bacterium]
MTEECKQEIKDYIDSKGFSYNRNSNVKFYGSGIHRGYYIDSEEGKNRKFSGFSYDGGDHQWESLDKYFLEFIGHILRKHDITEVNLSYDIYESNNWKFGSIEWAGKL